MTGTQRLTSLGRSQKYLFVFAQTLYGLLLHSPQLQNVSFLGLWVLLILRRNFMVWGSWPMVYACEAGQEEKKTMGPTWAMSCVPKGKNFPLQLAFCGFFTSYSGRVHSTFIKKMVLPYLKDVCIFDSQTFCHIDGLYLHLCFSEYCTPAHPVRLRSRCGDQQAGSQMRQLQWGSRCEY